MIGLKKLVREKPVLPVQVYSTTHHTTSLSFVLSTVVASLSNLYSKVPHTTPEIQGLWVAVSVSKLESIIVWT